MSFGSVNQSPSGVVKRDVSDVVKPDSTFFQTSLCDFVILTGEIGHWNSDAITLVQSMAERMILVPAALTISERTVMRRC